MARVLCAVCGKPFAGEAVREAIDFARDHDADIEFLGVVTHRWVDAPQPSGGMHRIRSFRQVESDVSQAVKAARDAGLTAEAKVRYGDRAQALMREAEAVGAEWLFLAEVQNRIWAALTGKPRVTVERINVPVPTRRVPELRLAA